MDVSSLGEPAGLMLQTIRNHLDNEYNDVKVDIRKHRIVFGRLTSLRWFLDIMPTKEGLILSIPTRGSQNNSKKVTVRTDSELHLAIAEIDVSYRSV